MYFLIQLKQTILINYGVIRALRHFDQYNPTPVLRLTMIDKIGNFLDIVFSTSMGSNVNLLFRNKNCWLLVSVISFNRNEAEAVSFSETQCLIFAHFVC